MSDYVLDASAVLTVIQEEPGSDRIEPHLRTACISSVNLAEIVTKRNRPVRLAITHKYLNHLRVSGRKLLDQVNRL